RLHSAASALRPLRFNITSGHFLIHFGGALLSELPDARQQRVDVHAPASRTSRRRRHIFHHSPTSITGVSIIRPHSTDARAPLASRNIAPPAPAPLGSPRRSRRRFVRPRPTPRQASQLP